MEAEAAAEQQRARPRGLKTAAAEAAAAVSPPATPAPRRQFGCLHAGGSWQARRQAPTPPAARRPPPLLARDSGACA